MRTAAAGSITDLISVTLIAIDELVERYDQTGDLAGMEAAMVARAAIRNLEDRARREHERRFSPAG